MVKSTRSVCLIAVLALLASSAAFSETLREARVIEESYTLKSEGPPRVVVDNIFGSVSIRGHKSESVQLKVRETRVAETKEGLARSWDEVGLEVFQREAGIEFFVDGPFRRPDCEDRRRSFRRNEPDYRVQYDFEILVPSQSRLLVKTVNDGDIEVVDVRGDFEVSNVNGSIRLAGLAGSGTAETINGEVSAQFDVNPRTATRFSTINGEVDVHFQPDLSAELRLEAKWGEVWSEYAVRPLPNPAPIRRVESGRTVIEFSSGSRVQVGAGGPILEFETLNGDIYVRRSESSG